MSNRRLQDDDDDFSAPLGSAQRAASNLSSLADLTIELDTAGFPMIVLPGLQFSIHWLPVTKIQIEYFLSAVYDAKYNEEWYNEILSKGTPRISPRAIRVNSYIDLFVTGILPAEAQRYSRWCGQGFDLPTEDEWLNAYKVLERIAAVPAAIDHICQTTGIRERTDRLLRMLEKTLTNDAGRDRKVVDQMVMRHGVYEYVYESDQRDTFAGIGQAKDTINPPRKGANRFTDRNRAEGARNKQYGFRLIKRRDDF